MTTFRCACNIQQNRTWYTFLSYVAYILKIDIVGISFTVPLPFNKANKINVHDMVCILSTTDELEQRK